MKSFMKNSLSERSLSSRSRTSVNDWSVHFARLESKAKHPALRYFYEGGVVSGITPIRNVPLLAMDFETTGLDPTQDDIVSIAVIPMSLSCIRLSESNYWLLKPAADLRHESIVIHGITHTEIQKAPDFELICLQLLEQMRGRIMLVHHQGIERQFLNAAMMRRFGEGIDFPCIDTMALEARLYRNTPSNLLQQLFHLQTKVSIRLPESRARYHLPHYSAHHAKTDALACAELFQAQVAHRFSPETSIRELWG